MRRSALIVVDMLVDFIDKDGALYCGPTADKIVPFVRQTIEQAREDGDLVVYVADSHRPDDREFEMFPKHCVKGTPGAQVIDELKPLRGDRIVRKTSLSAFYRTRLESILKEKRIGSVGIVGVCTSTPSAGCATGATRPPSTKKAWPISTASSTGLPWSAWRRHTARR